MNATPVEEEPMAGPSGVRRKRARSSSTDSTSSSSGSSSSSSSLDKRKRSRRHRHKKNKNRHSKWHHLAKEIGELRNLISQPPPYNCDLDDQVSIYSRVSGDLYNDEAGSNEQITDYSNALDTNFSFDIETKLKEPSVPKTPDNFVKMLADVQHFGNSTWSDVRYADTQKLYNHTPGFVDLETNEEIRSYDLLPHLAKDDKAYAAITFCVLKQKECLQENIRSLLAWAKSDSSDLNNFPVKVEELFLKGELHKVSTDLIQLVCGHRAEVVEVKRDAILKHVKDPVVKKIINKIPPSNTHIFEADAFSSALEKAGGVRKTFWPLKSENSQRGNNKGYRRPSRGTGTKKFTAPSNGAQNPCYVSGSSCHSHNTVAPSRGVCNNLNSNQHNCHTNTTYENIRGSFQYRGSKPRGSQRGRGRSYSHARGQSKQ